MEFTLSKRDCAFGKYALGCGLGLRNVQGLFSKITREGVWDDLCRWITDGWLGLDLGGREKEPARNSSSGGGAAMASSKEHAGVHGSVAMGHETRK